ncbi:MAG: quinone oxidoreductase [Vicinamibacteria bacterium]|nr:quinone oxidoreductase [Vicinamibacteria bacterium]
MKAIRIHEHGGPEVLRLEEIDDPTIRGGEAIVRVAAAGVNFIDVYHRTGLYRPAEPPFIPGVEAAGRVEAVGEGVGSVQAGDIVAFAGPLGSYAEHVAVAAERLVVVPAGIDPRIAAAVILQGLTAHYLTASTFPLEDSHTCLVHAAAGGVGRLLCQMAKMRGARVIGTVSSDDKGRMARSAGADDVIRYDRDDFEQAVRNLTAGRGVEVVYDGVGRSTYEKSLNCLAARGMLVLFGNASGAVPPIDPLVLSNKGSVFLTRPTIGHYTATRAELLQRSANLFEWVRQGRLSVHIDRELPLGEAAQAHRDLEARRTSGKLLLVP